MTIRFAAARARGKSPLHTWRCRSVPLCAANDNTRATLDDGMLIASLRHFASHGLASAETAGAYARTAIAAGDEAAFDHWLAICAQFDRRMALHLRRRNG
ncbi:hypothetical protein GGR39_002553 [Novosphingobium fluoreni]|uniref:Uncharacterized protein n=1 Tax=Novosphingobium fluoreni TaxID=1391222 RepID=A0A7W6FZA1_9SPHN|nr:hypothetical protein [Novosphingobium fluoreni]MBB3940890.1 hypothetical protein [Novosphingobium fluoreni]